MAHSDDPKRLRHPEVVVDASVWVSILLRKDSNHRSSLVWWQEYRSRGGIIVSPDLLLVEVASALGRQTKKPDFVQETVSYLVTSNVVTFVQTERNLLLVAADLAGRLGLKGADSIYVAAAHQKGLPLVSWDAEQLERAKVIFDRYTPETFSFSR